MPGFDLKKKKDSLSFLYSKWFYLASRVIKYTYNEFLVIVSTVKITYNSYECAT